MPQPQSQRAILLVLMSEGFLSRLGAGIIAFALPLYGRQLGMSLTEISVLISLNLIVGMLLKPMLGPLVDKFGHRLSAVTALAARSALFLLFGLAGTAMHLAILQALRGVTKCVRDPAIYAILATFGGKKRIARTFAWYQAAKGSAGSLGHAVAGFLLTLTAGSYGWVFAVSAAIALLPCFILPVFMAKYRPPNQPSAEPKPIPQVTTPRAKPKKPLRLDLAPFVGFGFIVSASSRMLRRMMPLLLVEYVGLVEAEAGMLYVLAAAITILATPVFGWLYDRVSPRLVLKTRSALNVASSLIYIFTPTFAGFATGKTLDKSGTAAFRPAWGALMAEASARKPKRRAGRIAVMSAGEDAGTVCGPILAGILWSTFGPVPMLAARLALSLAAEVYTLFLLRWMARRDAGTNETSGHNVEEQRTRLPGWRRRVL